MPTASSDNHNPSRGADQGGAHDGQGDLTAEAAYSRLQARLKGQEKSSRRQSQYATRLKPHEAELLEDLAAVASDTPSTTLRLIVISATEAEVDRGRLLDRFDEQASEVAIAEQLAKEILAADEIEDDADYRQVVRRCAKALLHPENVFKDVDRLLRREKRLRKVLAELQEDSAQEIAESKQRLEELEGLVSRLRQAIEQAQTARRDVENA